MLRIQGQPSGCSAVALDDIKDHILAPPEAAAYFAIGLAFADDLQHLGAQRSA
jgi:hypothetical protein